MCNATEKRGSGNWWRGRLMGLYAPTLELELDGTAGVVEMPPEETAEP